MKKITLVNEINHTNLMQHCQNTVVMVTTTTTCVSRTKRRMVFRVATNVQFVSKFLGHADYF